MRFAVDDASWAPDEVVPEALEAGLDALADRLIEARERGEDVGLYDGFWGIHLVGAHRPEHLLFDAANPRGLGRDVRLRVARLLDQIAANGFDEGALPDVEADVAGARLLTPAAILAWAAVGARRAVGCITPPCSGRSGATAVAVAGEVRTVHYVADEATHVAFFRAAIELENADEDAFAALAPSAFPMLGFADDLWRGLRDLSRPYRDRRNDLVRHLSVLNDRGAELFALREHLKIETGFAAHGITISPETTETMADGRCRGAREATFDGRRLVFEWHTKIEPHVDRIHVRYVPAPPTNRVVVGILHRHLPLPGDV